ncbi:DUF5320 domain-containing protein [bacterium]|nr:DUF5320 domain-containing protein [bacterium]
MPRGDRTGPQGMGPKTGRALGLCSGHPVPGYANAGRGGGAGGQGLGLGRGQGRGRGQGQGRGPGRGFRAQAPPTSGLSALGETPLAPEQEAEALRQHAEALEGQLHAIQTRIDELEAPSTSG